MVFLSGSVAEESVPLSCGNQMQVWENITGSLKELAECGETPPPTWSAQRTAAALIYMRNLTDALHKHQLKECQGAEPRECHEAEVPDNGGLVCATAAKKRYCKPMCNDGYDFGFLRRSRPFEECSEQTGYKWQSQYVGGKKLALCHKSYVQVSGQKSAYFARNQDCIITQSNKQLRTRIIEDFKAELRNQGVEEEPQYACLVCG
ncbi:uncharacterized protein KZ484_011216 [Pholidichthys leucotaenia]